MHVDNYADARTALDAYTTLRRFNLAMWRALTPEQLAALLLPSRVRRAHRHVDHGADGRPRHPSPRSVPGRAAELKLRAT